MLPALFLGSRPGASRKGEARLWLWMRLCAVVVLMMVPQPAPSSSRDEKKTRRAALRGEPCREAVFMLARFPLPLRAILPWQQKCQQNAVGSPGPARIARVPKTKPELIGWTHPATSRQHPSSEPLASGSGLSEHMARIFCATEEANNSCGLCVQRYAPKVETTSSW